MIVGGRQLIYIGTSGWLYPWNSGKSLDWYIKNTGFNAVELNASFYRVPSPEQVEKWRNYEVTWAIKVNRRITHVKRLKGVRGEVEKFVELFKPLNPRFYLFQLPPNFHKTNENVQRVNEVCETLGDRAAVEFRSVEWFKGIPDVKCVVVSIDSPIGNYYFNSNGIIYLRMHGRDNWYFYEYSANELKEVAEKLVALNARDIFVFFNNDLWMLENGKLMKEILLNSQSP
ncbi:DUF72 domain-containing protein [Stygiolobus caldivivus]|uniref:DUF72 domain-containing protein n=1 Tax=Stygiolobus caldivivus TaxID=2824673 RepID=A0A8D5U472_9CREN|nr:DUF72 domain-containing protein [Stygiolobus caldivivus]BCU68937.1 hypothetical protein KN1_02340 [Stygiolobus caldivivus]